MNILVLTRCMVQPDNDEKGATNVVFFLAREWVKRGHRVVMIHNSSNFPGIYYKVPRKLAWKFAGDGLVAARAYPPLEREEDGVQILRLPMLKLIPHGSYFSSQYKKQCDLIDEHLKKLDFVPDVVTGHWPEPQLELVKTLGERYHAKTALVVHGELSEKFAAKKKAELLGLNRLFFRSVPVLEKMLAKYDFLTAEHCRVCYSGIPDDFILNTRERSDWKKDGKLRVAFVGRLVAYKRVDVILEALSKAFDTPSWVFDIIGDGPESENLKKKAAELGISEQVDFVGRIPREEVIERMQNTDCFAMVSENEVFGLVYLEAMAAGCLTIASKNGGVDGIIRNGENGFLSAQGDADELSVLLREIAGLPEERVAELRKNARQTVRDFSDSKVAEKYLNDIIS